MFDEYMAYKHWHRTDWPKKQF